MKAWVLGGAAALAMMVLGAAPAWAGYAAYVVDGRTGKVLEEVNADVENHPASLTKLMTMYMAFEAVRDGRLHWEQMLPVSRNAANKSPTKLGLRPGERISLRDCVLGMITVSANDAATVVGEALAGGSEQAFARMMTEKARQLGMTHTVFVNASGLPDRRQVSTAHDMARLAMALHHDFPEDYPLFATRSFMFQGHERVGHNHLMYRYPGMDGMKTGFTNASGFNLVSSAVHDGRRLFGVVFGGRSGPARDQLMGTMLDNAFAGRETSPLLVAAAAGEPLNLRGTRRHHVMLAAAHVRHRHMVARHEEKAHTRPHTSSRTRHGHHRPVRPASRRHHPATARLASKVAAHRTAHHHHVTQS